MPDDRERFSPPPLTPRRTPPRPSSPGNDVIWELFLEEYWEDRKAGITSRSMHEMLKEHIGKDEHHQSQILQRVASIEANDKRDAEDRLTGTGRFPILPAYATPQVPPSRSIASEPPTPTSRARRLRPWWAEAASGPLKYFLAGISLILLTWLAIKLGVPTPTPLGK